MGRGMGLGDSSPSFTPPLTAPAFPSPAGGRGRGDIDYCLSPDNLSALRCFDVRDDEVMKIDEEHSFLVLLNSLKRALLDSHASKNERVVLKEMLVFLWNMYLANAGRMNQLGAVEEQVKVDYVLQGKILFRPP